MNARDKRSAWGNNQGADGQLAQDKTKEFLRSGPVRARTLVS